MHSSLRPVTNLFLLVIWGSIAGAVVFLASPVPWGFTTAGLVVGLCLGVIQLKALRESPPSFISARTMMDVRRALIASRSGRLYVALFWISSATFLIAALYMAPQGALVAFIGAYAAFALVRELITLRGTYELAKLDRAAVG